MSEDQTTPDTAATYRLPPPRLDEHGAALRARGWAAFDGGAPDPATG